ncbi:DUF4097 domain-containing protein [bacterium]|nr:DUF4097 domain-containing protein [bacterium]
MRVVALLLVCALIAMAGVAAAETRNIKKEFDETFSVEEGVNLHLSHDDGDVTITPWDKDQIHVVVRYDATVSSGGIWVETDLDVEFRQEGNDLYVIGQDPDHSGFGWMKRNTLEYRYEISAPSYTRLLLDGDDGDVAISGWLANIKCSLDDGDIAFDDIDCEHVQISLGDGGVQLGGVSAKLNVSTDDGGVALDSCRLSSCRISTDDGSVSAVDCSGDFAISLDDGSVFTVGCSGEFAVSLDDGDVTMKRLAATQFEVASDDGDVVAELVVAGFVDVAVSTDDGDVDVRLHPDVSAMVAITVDDGDVSIAHSGFERLEKDRHRLTGRLGTGEGSVRIRTDDGDISIAEVKSGTTGEAR